MKLKTWTTVLAAAVAVVILSLPANAAKQETPHQLVITQATADVEQELLTIVGLNFGEGVPAVTLAGWKR